MTDENKKLNQEEAKAKAKAEAKEEMPEENTPEKEAKAEAEAKEGVSVLLSAFYNGMRNRQNPFTVKRMQHPRERTDRDYHGFFNSSKICGKILLCGKTETN